MKLERFQCSMDDGIYVDPETPGEWTDYNDAAALIAKLREKLVETLDLVEEEWGADRGADDQVGRLEMECHALIAATEGIEPDKGSS